MKTLRKEDRIKVLSALEFDFTYTDLLNMPDADFNALVLKLENERDAKIAAEKKAEEERIAKEKAEAAERERIRKENEQLKAEAEAREKSMAEERRKAEVEQAKLREQTKKEAEAREKAEEELRLKKEREQKEAARIEAENKARELAKEKAALAPDKEKLIEFADNIFFNTAIPKVQSDEAKAIIEQVKHSLQEIVDYVKTQSQKL